MGQESSWWKKAAVVAAPVAAAISPDAAAQTPHTEHSQLHQQYLNEHTTSNGYVIGEGRGIAQELQDKQNTDGRVYTMDKNTVLSPQLTAELQTIRKDALQHVLDEIKNDELLLAQNPNDEYINLKYKRDSLIRDNYYQNLDAKSIVADIASSWQWLYQNVTSAPYYERLLREGLSPTEAKKVQNERAERIKQWSYVVNAESDGSHPRGHGPDGKAASFIATQIADEPMATELHEGEHNITVGNAEMTPKAIETYTKAAISYAEFLKVQQTPAGKLYLSSASKTPEKNYAYLTNQTEMDARKKVLDREMEILGVKRPEQKATHETWVMLQQLLLQGKLSVDAAQILLMSTEEGFLHEVNDVAGVLETRTINYADYVSKMDKGEQLG